MSSLQQLHLLPGPTDSDLELAASALGDQPPPLVLAEFERRWVEDEAFRASVRPIVDAFLIPVDWAQIAAELDVAESQARVSSEQQATQARERRNQRILFFMKVAAIVAGLAVVGGGLFQLGAVYWLSDPGADRAVTITPVQPGRATAAATDSVRQSESQLHLLDLYGQTLTADSGNTAHMELSGGSSIRVNPGSTIRHATLPGKSRLSILEVRGEAVVYLTHADNVIGVVSRAGVASLSEGTYALRCVGACAALEVTVVSGSALVSNDWHPGTRFSARAGEFARAFRDAPPQQVSAADAAGFPKAGGAPRRTP